MASFYFTDKVSFVVITEDPVNGGKIKVPADGEPRNIISCRVEDTNKTFKNGDGEIIEANSLIMWPKSVIIKKGDFIQITEIMGVTKSDEKEYEVQQAMPAGGFGVSHIEVYI